MAGKIETIPETVRRHLEEVTRTSGLPDTRESYERIAKIWLEKEKLFEQQIKALDMSEVDELGLNDLRGAIILTYSGSLVSLGTLTEGIRWAEYASIKLRKNVPELGISNEARLSKAVRVNEHLEFDAGPVRRTSPVLKVAVCPEDVPVEKQERRIREGTLFLTHSFVKLNRTVVLETEVPERFTMKTLTDCIADKHDLSRKQAKEVIDDFLLMVESGMLLGERVPLGKIGKLYLKNRPAQKARLTRNPATGEEITVEAKPETAMPRISFSKYMKERAASVVLED